MIRRYGYRRILPIAQLALFFLLIAAGALQMESSQQKPHLRPMAYQQPSIPDWHPQPPPTMPIAWLIAISINVPATMIGAVCAEIFHIGSNFGGLICSAPFVLLLWQLFGRWLDRQVGNLPCRAPGLKTRVACWIGIGVSAVLLAVGVMAFRSHKIFTAEVFILAVAWLAWSALLFVMCLLTLRRPCQQVVLT